MTSIIDFLNENSIAWFPIAIDYTRNAEGVITGKTIADYTHPLHAHKYYNGRPSFTQFKQLAPEVIKARQSLLHLSNCIAIDTNEVFQIDIDTLDYDDMFDIIASQSPLFKSVRKGLPHIFIKSSDFVKDKEKYVFDNLGVGEVDFLTGQWSWCSKDAVVENTHFPITDVPSSQIIPHIRGYAKTTPTVVTNAPTGPMDKWKDLVANIIINGDKIDYKEWMKMGAVMKFNGFSLADFINFTNNNNKLEDTIAHWERFTNKGISLEYLIKLAKLTNESGYKQWKTKWNSVVTDANAVIICDTEDEASNYLFERMKGYLKSYKGRLFYKRDFIWLCDTKSIEDALLCEIMDINICRKGDRPYSKNYNDAIKIRNSLIAKIRTKNEDSDLYNKFHSTTRGKFCFMDGVLDMTNKTFRLWKDIKPDEIYTTVMIPRNFEQYWNKPNQADIDDLKAKLFEPLYGNKMAEALHFLSRAMGGFVCDKRWATYLGNRNCGKGVEYMLLNSAFGSYVSTFELGNILYTRKTAGFDSMDSKRLYWLMDLEFVRLAVSQEIPDINSGLIGNGKMIKKMSGGDDTIVARRNYDRFDTHFIIDSTFYIKGNFSFQCDSNDCYETCCQYSSVTQFKTQAEINAIKADETRSETELKRYRLSDPNIKDKCISEQWSNACIMLMVQNFKSFAVPIMLEDSDEVEINEVIAGINEKYEITLDAEHMILADDIKTRLPLLDKKKIALELQAMNVHKVRCNKTGPFRNKWVYTGIKVRPPPPKLPIIDEVEVSEVEDEEEWVNEQRCAKMRQMRQEYFLISNFFIFLFIENIAGESFK